LLWLLVAFVVRGQTLKEHTDLLANRLAELTFPDQSAEHRINSIAEALRRQAVDLRLATEEAAAALDGTRALFRSQASDIEQFLGMTPEIFARSFGHEHYIEPGVGGPMRSGWPLGG